VRVVSLLPSATEIVYALGAGQDLVGASHECDHPPVVTGLPALTGSRPSAPARGADR
jgi:iron complex transport system substrate-binding protein